MVGVVSPEDVRQLYRNMGKEPPAEFGSPTFAAAAAPKRTEKYGRKKKEFDGIMFDSTLEADCWPILKLWESMGIVRELIRQPIFVLQEKFVEASTDGPRKTHRAIKYVADFQFKTSPDNRFMAETVVIDAKGVKTPAFRIKEKMFRQKFPAIDLQVWDKSRVKELSRC